MFKRCDNKKRRPRQEAEDLLLTMRLDGHQVKIAYTAEPCCRSHCIPYSIFRQPFSLFDHSPIFRMTGGSARARLVAISICSYRQALEGRRSRGSCSSAAKKTRAQIMDSCNRLGKTGQHWNLFQDWFILSLPYGIVKRFAKVGPNAGLRVCSSFFCKFEIKRKAQGEHLTNSLPCARSAMSPKRGLTNEAHPNGSGRSLSRSIIF